MRPVAWSRRLKTKVMEWSHPEAAGILETGRPLIASVSRLDDELSHFGVTSIGRQTREMSSLP